jgi:pSer/pThr/pTyr-binding forkhead associated (FHA) protein
MSESICLRLQLLEEQTSSISYTLTDEAVIGRVGSEDDPHPEIDLSPYTGYQLGISRRHLLLRLCDGQVEAQDLGSRNGTIINGYRLTPDETMKVSDQDEIRLGRLVMILHIESIDN